MEKEYYYVGVTVDEAIKKGLKDLALTEDAVKIEVIEGGSAGIFGLFKKEAKVKLVPLDEDYNKEEAVKLAKATEEVVEVEKVAEKEQEEVVVEKVVEQDVHTEETKPAAEEEPVVEAEQNEEQVKKAKREDYIVKNKDRIVNYLQNIVVAMGYPDATVDFREDGNRHFTLNIKTEENTSLIIGKRGITLNSLQFLVNNYAKKFSSHYFRIEVDCDDYRENRKKTLEGLALNLAKKSKKIGKPVELEPMTSIERKIIHNALTGIKNVETESRGEEPHRYLVITAK